MAEEIKPKSAYKNSTAAGIDLKFDSGELGDQTIVEVWVKSSVVATFNVYGSRNRVDWRLFDTIPVLAAAEAHRSYNNAYRHLRVETATVGDHEVEIVTNGS